MNEEALALWGAVEPKTNMSYVNSEGVGAK
jgi:hypothetical protein